MIRRLAVVLFITTVVVNGGLFLLPGARSQDTLPMITARFAAQVIAFSPEARRHGDSWGATFTARRQLADHPGEPVYSALLERGAKFQYPPTSLLLTEITPRVARPFVLLNTFLWVLLWVNAVLVGLILLASSDQYLEPERFAASRGQRIAIVVLGAALTLSFYPTVRAVWLGQIQAAANTAFAASIWLAMRGRWGAGGALLGTVCLFKPHYGLMLVWGALRRRWRLVAGMLAVLIPIGLMSVAVYGLPVHLEYVSWLAHIGNRGEAFYPNQSINGLLNRWFQTGDVRTFDGRHFPTYHPVVHAGTVAATVTFGGLGMLWRLRREPGRSVQGLMVALLCFTLASPIAWEHHYGLLAPIFAWLLPVLVRRPVLGRWTMPLLLAAFLVSGHLIRATVLFTGTPLGVLQSYLFFAAIIVLALLCLASPENGRARVHSAAEEGDTVAPWPPLTVTTARCSCPASGLKGRRASWLPAPLSSGAGRWGARLPICSPAPGWEA